MELLLNPNVAYVLLMAGMVIALLAIVTPGTGALEVSAFFLLALVGYIIYRIGLNPWALIVLILSIAPFAYATRKPKRRLWLGLSLAVMLIASMYLFNTEGWLPRVDPILAVVISALAGGFIWVTVGKTLKAYMAPPSHNLESLIGQIGEAKTRVHASGSVQAAGELWSARSHEVIHAGQAVRVVGREGFTLLVEKAEKESA